MPHDKITQQIFATPLGAMDAADWLIRPPLVVALVIALVFAALAFSARLLTATGALATFVVGFVTFGLAGGKFAVPLLTFFLTSSLLSRVGRRLKQSANARVAKGATRDWTQVLANGGAATMLAFGFWMVVRHQPVEISRYLLVLYTAALATVNADTWATEIGGLSRSRPWMLSTWKPAEPGTSGAVTLLGTFASLLGSLAVTVAGGMVWGFSVPEFLTALWAGFLGSFLDSLLGAGIQAVYRDPTTGAATEMTRIDGIKTVKLRGLAWMNNDVVNFLASVGGVLFAWVMLRYCVYPFR